MERIVTVELEDGSSLAVMAEQVGSALVSNDNAVARLSSVTSSIEGVSRSVLEEVKGAAPSKATVELGFGVAIEAGQLIALFGKAKGEATITVTLEWSRSDERPKPS